MEISCSNCGQDYQAYVRSCDIYKKEKKILSVKQQRNVPFLKGRKIVGTYLGENSYTSVARRENITNADNKYRTLVEKLIQLEVNDWAKVLEQLKKNILGRILPSTSYATGLQ